MEHRDEADLSETEILYFLLRESSQNFCLVFGVVTAYYSFVVFRVRNEQNAGNVIDCWLKDEETKKPHIDHES